MVLDIKKIELKFIEAKEKASKKNNQILFSITNNIKISPNSLIDLNLDQYKEKVYWSQPFKKIEFITWGNVLDLNPNNNKSDVNREIQKMIFNKLECNLTKEKNIPVFIGGQNFDINKSNENIWINFPRFNYQVPSILIFQKNNITTITFNFIINDHLMFSTVSNRIEKYIEIIENYSSSINKKTSSHFELTKIKNDGKKFSTSFSIIKDKINEEEIEKAIISDIITYSFKGGFPINNLLLKLRKMYSECTIFLYDYPGKGKYLGASPEKIFSLENNNLEIDALAGSINRKNNKSDDISNTKLILQDKKINKEHHIVVRGIIESLDKIGIEINNTKKSVLTLKNILHLKTLIKAKIISPNNPMDILDFLSPTPALSGYPKKKSMDIINTIENHDRGWYSGAIGWVDNNLNSEFFAGLRSMFIDKNKLYIYAGAGITKDSNKNEEWDEILYKMDTIEELIHE